ncbi:MAG: Mo-dependent nitrogenase C-terminal domain-containing protein [Cyanobacteria bacterium J06635_1]
MATLFPHTSFPSCPITLPKRRFPSFDIFKPLRRRIDQIQVRSHRLAHLICRVIPCQCPFERDISVLGYELHIPALCKLNPVYDELVSLRLRALSYLSDVFEEDITQYIC